MTEYSELVKSLRCCGDVGCHKCPYQKHIHEHFCWTMAMHDAAAAIEALQAELIRIYKQLPKRGEWEPFDLTYGRSIYSCSVCEQATEVPMCMEKPMYAYCPNCGAKMNDSNASNASNALDNAQDGPIITPCRGCSDYDGYGGCKSKGGCARAKMEVQE